MEDEETFIDREKARLLAQYNCTTIDEVIKVLEGKLTFIP
jgi:hypothetical protein